MKIRITPRARDDLQGIRSYLVARNPDAARNVMRTIVEKLRRHDSFPFSARLTNEQGVRKLPVERYPYLIFYRVENEDAFILHVRHGAMSGERDP